jgi:hypothetical protein
VAVAEKKVFVADDGRQFDDRQEAERYDVASRVANAPEWETADTMTSGFIALQLAGWRFVPPGEPLPVAEGNPR